MGRLRNKKLNVLLLQQGDGPSSLYNTYEMINGVCVPVILEGRGHSEDVD